jgi:YggT family protein
VHVVGYLIEIVLWLYIVLLFTRFIVDWVQMFAGRGIPAA